MKFLTLESEEAVNERLKKVDLNVLAEKHGRREDELFKFDAIGLELFVSSLLRETFYEKE